MNSFPSPFIPTLVLCVFKDDVTVLDDELHRSVLGVHISHLALEAGISHDGRGEYNGQILR